MKKFLFIVLSTLLFIFLSAVFSKPALAGEWANPNQTCSQYCASTGGRPCTLAYNAGSNNQVVGSSCSFNLTQSCDSTYLGQQCCECVGAPPAATPTPTPPFDPCAQWVSQGWTQFCPNVNPPNGLCISPAHDCSTATNCGGAVGWRVCPSGYRVNCFPLECRLIATPTPTTAPKQVNFGIVFSSYSIRGKIFKDLNSDLKSNGEPNYTGRITIGLANNQASFAVTKNDDGTYSAINLLSGQYTITFSGLPPGITFTYPTTPGNSLNVTVGASCSVPPTSEASCSSGNIINLNAGVTGNESAWFQSVGSDMRWDSGFTNHLTLPSGKFASIPGLGGMPGIIFSGSTTFGQPTQASENPFNWQVGSFQNPDVFTQAHGLIPSSYRFLLETAQSSGITPTAIANVDNNLIHGIYKTDGDLTINAPVTFKTDCGLPSCNYIILVNGNLNINQEIKVPVGSTAIFSAKEDIAVSQNVGESNPASAASNIEGLYSADRNFYTQGQQATCPSITNKRLNIAGSVIANAGRAGGRLVNHRSLCDNNSSNPSVTFIERPDFMLNYPALVTQINRVWQDVAP